MRPGGDEVGICWGSCHVMWGLCYVTAGAVQLVAGLFALFSLPVLGLGSNVWTGAWNISAGITSALLAGLVSEVSATRQELLLYASLSVLGINTANLVLLEAGEWSLLLAESTKQEIAQRGLSRLVYYARISTSISTALVMVASLIDSHISFCVLQARSRHRAKRALESINDIEYVIPRKRTIENEEEEENLTSRSHNLNAQSWVFDADATNSSDIPCLQTKLDIHEDDSDNNSPSDTPKSYLLSHASPPSIVVKLDPAPSVHEDRTLNYMKSFSRTPSPTCSLNHLMYECVPDNEASPARSRLYTADNIYHQRSSFGGGDNIIINNNKRTHRRCESFDNRPHSASSMYVNTGRVQSEKIQYASLMLELEQTLQSKRPSYKNKIPPDQNESSPDTSDQSPRKDSDTEFSKELEAALQLLQNLGSPTTIDTPSEPSHSLHDNTTAATNHKEQSENGKSDVASSSHNTDEDGTSSSGYSSPAPGNSFTQLCPVPDVPQPFTIPRPQLSCTIRNEGPKAIVSLYPDDTIYQRNGVTIVKINSPPTPAPNNLCVLPTRKKRITINPEFANVIYEYESLVYLSELELLARHCRTKAEQRQIELRAKQKVHSSMSSVNGASNRRPDTTYNSLV